MWVTSDFFASIAMGKISQKICPADTEIILCPEGNNNPEGMAFMSTQIISSQWSMRSSKVPHEHFKM